MNTRDQQSSLHENLKEDLKALSHIGSALWFSPRRAQQVSVDTLSTIALLDLTPERYLERLAGSLIERAALDGLRTNAEAVHDPFYRLQSEERLVLSALHVGNWSYDRLARILKVSPEKVQEIAWSARLHLASAPGHPVYLPHPVGSGGVSNCPEYHPARPWTQRFFDEEISHREQVFIQDHLRNCPGCQQAVNRCRVMYYGVEKMIPRASEKDVAETTLAMEETLKQARLLRSRVARPFLSSLRSFSRRGDVRLILVFIAFVVLERVMGWGIFY